MKKEQKLITLVVVILSIVGGILMAEGFYWVCNNYDLGRMCG